MSTLDQTTTGGDTLAHSIARATVVAVTAEVILVESKGWRGPRPCLVLRAAAEPPRFAEGDAVLVWLPRADDEPGVVLGQVGAPAAADEARHVPDELLIEAKHGLTLKCGDGAIVFRSDGKVLIKGKELVSHAQGRNRIRGASVAIN